ncbi:hypothetical protein ILYODFUR_011624 [Ilyodon furcidens]|uniref:Secreted protein n=1 Tax=Ilyodon furcidens TaxID=33524 RepID=A0ABV0SW51_9TELE
MSVWHTHAFMAIWLLNVTGGFADDLFLQETTTDVTYWRRWFQVISLFLLLQPNSPSVTNSPRLRRFTEFRG